LHDWRVELDTMLKSISATFYQLPCKIDNLWLDDSFKGVIFWYKGCLEISESAKKKKGK
jgi:hypothetical protein